MVEIEVDADAWGESLEQLSPLRKTRKSYALALVDYKDRIWEGRNIPVKFEVFRGKGARAGPTERFRTRLLLASACRSLRPWLCI